MRLVAGASLLLLTVAAPAAGQDPRIEPVLVELQMARLASRTIPAHRIDDQALIPVVALFELAEIRTEPRAEGEVFAILQPGNKKVRILPVRQRIELSTLCHRRLASRDLRRGLAPCVSQPFVQHPSPSGNP